MEIGVQAAGSVIPAEAGIGCRLQNNNIPTPLIPSLDPRVRGELGRGRPKVGVGTQFLNSNFT